MCLFFNDTATTEIYTLSLHDALPICLRERPGDLVRVPRRAVRPAGAPLGGAAVRSGDVRPHVPHLLHRRDRKSTRLNSSHANISYAVFCLKKNSKINFLHFTHANVSY